MKTMAVVSGKGGTGKSFFVLNFAAWLAKLGLRVAVLDANFYLGNFDTVLGVKIEKSLKDLIRSGDSIKEVWKEVSGFHIIASIGGQSEMFDLPKYKLDIVAQSIKDLDEDLDYLFIDCESGMSKTVAYFMHFADEAIIVVNNEPSSMMNAYIVAQNALAEKNDLVVRILCNRMANASEAGAVFDNIQKTVFHFNRRKVGYLGYVREDSEVMCSLINRVLLAVCSPECVASQDIAKIAETLCADQHPGVYKNSAWILQDVGSYKM